MLQVKATRPAMRAAFLFLFFCALDYYNLLLSGCPKHLEKLQKVQNSAARLVLKAHKRDHVLPLLRTLHWLPIHACIEYKLSTLLSLLFLWYNPCLSV